VDYLVGVLRHLPPVAAYAVAAALVFAETGLIIGLFLPGEATLLLVGFLAYAGPLRLTPAIAVMALAGIVGDVLAFSEGRRVGERLRAGRLGRRVGEARWDRADALLTRHGGRAVAVSRFVAVARTLTPRLAGMSGVPLRTFLPWNLAGVAGCVTATILVGYAAGGSYHQIADIFGRATGTLFLLGLVVAGLVLVGRYLGRHRGPVTAFGARLVSTRPLRGLRGGYAAGMARLTGRYGVRGAVAVNLVLGILALLGLGAALAWLSGRLVHQSGLPLIDPVVDDLLAGSRSPAAVRAALLTLSLLRGPYLVVAVGVVGVVLSWRRAGDRRRTLMGAIASAGMFVPLVILALAADWLGPERGSGIFPGQVTLVTASLGLLAWLLGRRLPWAGAVAVWTGAVAGVVLVAGARLYLRWSWPSEVLGAVLLGALWTLVFAVAWHTREQVRQGEAEPAPEAEEILAAAER
jgi:membrane protein DedA with SNARE-associated domain/membrane-associated phospholipid phosphatase